MFELPDADLEKVIIDENSANNSSEPIKLFKSANKKTSSGN
jgi:ATP-dependent Clp protease ATP-binding subunit ClpX